MIYNIGPREGETFPNLHPSLPYTKNRPAASGKKMKRGGGRHGQVRSVVGKSCRTVFQPSPPLPPAHIIQRYICFVLATGKTGGQGKDLISHLHPAALSHPVA